MRFYATKYYSPFYKTGEIKEKFYETEYNDEVIAFPTKKIRDAWVENQQKIGNTLNNKLTRIDAVKLFKHQTGEDISKLGIGGGIVITLTNVKDALSEWFECNDCAPEQFNIQKLRSAQDNEEWWICEFCEEEQWSDCTLWASGEKINEIINCKDQNELDELIDYSFWNEEFTEIVD